MTPIDETSELNHILQNMSELPVKVAMSDCRAKFTNEVRIRSLINQSDVEAIIAITPETVPYLSGYYNLDLRLLREYLHIAIWPREGDPVLICRNLGPGRQYIDPFVRDLRIYRENITPINLLADLIIERNWSTARLGIEKNYFPVGQYEELVQRAPSTEFVDCRELIDKIKMVKTSAEIELYRKIARITEKAILCAYELARPGLTEKNIADLIGYFITTSGADTVAFNVVASGSRTVLGHHYAENEPLMEGDLLRADFGGLFTGYYTDVARTAVVGRASPHQRSVYQRVAEVHQEMLGQIRPGVIPRDLTAQALKRYAALGLPPTRAFFGHSIGLSVHEEPSITVDVEQPIESDMVLCIEHGWADESRRERYHIEDIILITEEGFELLTDYAPTDSLYEIR